MAKKISPLDENGRAVDWWFIYKVPQMDASNGNPASTGYEYFYYDPVIGKLILSPNQLTNGKGALDLTLASIFKSPATSTGWILYNDEMPSVARRQDSGIFGHTKGVIAFNTASKTAFWLLHSWPKFANPKSKKLPVPAYGQTFLCLSLDLETAGMIANQMDNHQEPQLYTPKLPSSLKKDHPLHLITKDVDPNAAGDSSVIQCKTRGGMKFQVIAKNRKWNKDFWIDLVGPTLKSSMMLETWIRGKIPPIKDSDGKHHVHDVKFIDFQTLGFPYVWPETKDHAKWGLAERADWICVGDINRMVSQEKRGGGTIAFKDKKLWNALKKTELLKVPPKCNLKDVKACIKATHRKRKK